MLAARPFLNVKWVEGASASTSSVLATDPAVRLNVYNDNYSVVEYATAGYHSYTTMLLDGAAHMFPLANEIWSETMELR